MPLDNLFYGPHDALARGASPTTLAVGDSWFWYPFDNLLGEIARQRSRQSIVVAGYNGSEASEWETKFAASIKLTFDMFARGPLVKALLISGGGNDIVGAVNLPKLIKANCSSCISIQDCYSSGQPGRALGTIAGCYRKLIANFRTCNVNAVVVLHNYDNAYPTGVGVFGPADWLKVPMDQCRVPEILREGLFADLVAQFGLMQDDLVADGSLGPITALKTPGTLPKDGWANELHPTPKGFKLLASKKFLPALDAIWGVRALAGSAPMKAIMPIAGKKAKAAKRPPSAKKAAAQKVPTTRKTAPKKMAAKKGEAKKLATKKAASKKVVVKRIVAKKALKKASTGSK